MRMTFLVNTRVFRLVGCISHIFSLFPYKMTDVQVETPSLPVNGSEAKDEKSELESEPINEASENVSESKSGESKDSPAVPKRQKYDGRSKKRRWEFNRRDDNVKRVRINPEDRVKRRKYLLLLGFAGGNYVGMQRNPGVNTIEEEILKAMFKNNMITEEAFNQPQYTHFQRAARTDKGVSAARQCISLKLPEEIDLTALNNDLPSDIKVFGLKRVTKGFNCKDQANARTYSYTLPSISFAPYKEAVDLTTFRLDEATLARVNETLKLFEGTKNFHNFTSRKKFEDPSARRFIMNFRCEPPFMVDDVEFCTIIVKGQSFMMHQIRKMIGLTIAVIRGFTSVETITKSFEGTRLDIPMAPGLGLVLDQVHYDGYNNRFKDSDIPSHEQLVWDEFEPAVQEFRDKFIYPVIKETELKEQPMLKWLDTLPCHSYDERVDGVDRMDTKEGKDDDSQEAKMTSNDAIAKENDTDDEE